MARNSFDFDDLIWIAGIAISAYAAIQMFRDMTATDSAGPRFEPTEPIQNPVSGAIDILVPMRASPQGQAFIKSNEGLTLTVKNDAGKRMVGYGHDILPGEQISSPITQDKAEQLFQQDLSTAENAVNNAVMVQVNQDQFDAMVDLAFNIGASAFAGSTLVQKINQGDFAGASAEFDRWDKSQRQVNQGLENRRNADTSEFNGGGIFA